MSTKGLLSEQPQGIGSILGGSEFEKPNRTGTAAAAASLRRTLSADMSSKKWLLQHGFSPLKRIASSEELQSEPSSDNIWNSNRSDEEKNNKTNEQQQQPGQYDMWSSILTQKPSSLPPPYVHPLVKRSKSSLTGKSLEICTENLGSDSGSDGFSSYSPSEISSSDDEEEVEEEVKESETVDSKQEEMAGNVVHDRVNYTTSCSASSVSKKSPPRSFPPPLPSLSRPGLHIRPRREDGRLVLQAITIPTQNYFHAQRQDGRLLLTFIKSPSQQQNMENDENEEEEIIEEIVEKVVSDDEEEEEEGFESEDEEEEAMIGRAGGFELEMELSQLPSKKLPTGVINVHRSAVMVNKLIGGLTINRNPNWSHKLEKMVQMEVEVEEAAAANDPTLYPQSLPSPPPRRAMPRLIPTSPTAAATASFNTYEYCWRRKPSSVTGGGIMTKESLPINNNIITSNNNNTINNNFLISSRNSSKVYQEKQQQFVVKRGRGGEKGDYLLAPLIKSCKEPRRSLLSWEPYCIATS